MLVKGIFLGIAAAVISVLFFMCLQTAQVQGAGPVSVDIRGVGWFLLKFYGGAAIGVGIVATGISAALYALRLYVLHGK